MERIVPVFDRNSARSSARGGFRFPNVSASAESDDAQSGEIIVKEPTSTPEIIPAVVDIKPEVEEQPEPENVIQQEEVVDIEPEQIAVENEIESVTIEETQPAEPEKAMHIPVFLHLSNRARLEAEAEAQPIPATVYQEEHDNREKEIEELKNKIQVLEDIIAVKDEYITKLKDYAQISDEELEISRARNKTLLEVTGKFIMKI